jgi:alpha-galactosidase
MLFNVDNPFSPYDLDPPLKSSAYWSYTFAPAIAHSWRTETDIGYLQRDKAFAWKDVLRNLYANAAQPAAAGPGHWNDPDYLGPENGMSPVEDQAQFTMWTMMAAPLVIGSDVRKISASAIAMLTNPEVIAIDQDPLGSQGTTLGDLNGAQVWTRALANPRALAIAFLNTASAAQQIQVNWADIGLGPIQDVRDLWARTDYGLYPGGFAVTVPAHGATLYLVSASDGN